MHSRTAPMWTVLNSDPKHEREFMNSFMAQSADLEDKMSSSYISRQVIAASASCCAEVEFIEIEYSEKSYAAPKMLYHD